MCRPKQVLHCALFLEEEHLALIESCAVVCRPYVVCSIVPIPFRWGPILKGTYATTWPLNAMTSPWNAMQCKCQWMPFHVVHSYVQQMHS